MGRLNVSAFMQNLRAGDQPTAFIHVIAYVTDENDVPISGLKKENFEVFFVGQVSVGGSASSASPDPYATGVYMVSFDRDMIIDFSGHIVLFLRVTQQADAGRLQAGTLVQLVK